MPNIETSIRFLPHTKRGMILLGGIILMMVGIAIGFFFLSSLTSEGLLFAAYLAIGVIACVPLPMLGYRFLALKSAYYDLDRNTLTIHWGLRTEIIPIREIQWIRPVSDLVQALPHPRLTLPGAFLGIKNVEGLGKVEYLADRLEGALLVAGPQIIYVISPDDERSFVSIYSRRVELGSLESISGKSILPSSMIGKLWDDSIFRNLILSGLLMGVAVAIWTIILITSRAEVIFGYQSIRDPEPVPTIRLLLLPVVNGLIFLGDVVAGAFYYRQPEQRILTYLVCSGSSITGLLILIALFILTVNP